MKNILPQTRTLIDASIAVFLSVWLISMPSVADDQVIKTPVVDKVLEEKQQKALVQDQFAALLANITEQLSTGQAVYLNDPVAYYDFLVTSVVNHWDSASTSRALLGKQAFLGLDQAQRNAMINAVEQTLIRYAYEGLENYSGQVFNVADVVVNANAGRGWVQVVMESPLLPDINLDLLIKRNPQGQWRAVDVRVKGITYVKIKKYQYRDLLKKQGFNALVQSLADKNQSHFMALCKNLMDPKQVGRKPC
jgi:phospholipid transport system substrate-binding protein